MTHFRTPNKNIVRMVFRSQKKHPCRGLKYLGFCNTLGVLQYLYYGIQMYKFRFFLSLSYCRFPFGPTYLYHVPHSLTHSLSHSFSLTHSHSLALPFYFWETFRAKVTLKLTFPSRSRWLKINGRIFDDIHENDIHVH